MRAQLRAEVVAFWLLGLLNNSGQHLVNVSPLPLWTCRPDRHLTGDTYAVYVIMIAGANEISSGAVGLVYFCAVLPSLLVKVSAPYW